MTEQEWLESASPWDMIDFLGPHASARKFRLFACACCRRVLNPFEPPLIFRAVEAGEAFADGEISADALASVGEVVAKAMTPMNRSTAPKGACYHNYLLGACLSICHSGSAADLAQEASFKAACARADVAPDPERGEE